MNWMTISMLTCMFLTACTSAPYEATPLPISESDIPKKRDVPQSFFNGFSISPISVSRSSFIEVIGWYDDQSVLYLEEHNNLSILYKHNLKSGESTLFYKVDGSILDLQANNDSSLFAIQVGNDQQHVSLIIVDANGDQVMTLNELAEGYSVFWNPYDLQTLSLVAYLPDWQIETYILNVDKKTQQTIEMNQSYMQWISATKIAYLNWDQLEPSYQTALFEIDVKTKEKQKWKDNVIAFISFPDDISLSITATELSDLSSTYTFYQDNKNYREIKVPILNTYSEQWWIPYYTYDPTEKVFYYLKPKSSGDYFGYQEGYDLVAYKLELDKEEKITTTDQNVPISISPGGNVLLMGDNFNQLMDLRENKLIRIVQE